MSKNYKKWHELKISIENDDKSILFNEREIWWCSVWENIWYEQDWKNNLYERPVLILKKFNNDIFFWLPITSKKKDNKYYYEYDSWHIKGSIIISQWRILSKKRLLRKISKIWRLWFLNIVKSFKNLF